MSTTTNYIIPPTLRVHTAEPVVHQQSAAPATSSNGGASPHEVAARFGAVGGLGLGMPQTSSSSSSTTFSPIDPSNDVLANSNNAARALFPNAVHKLGAGAYAKARATATASPDGSQPEFDTVETPLDDPFAAAAAAARGAVASPASPAFADPNAAGEPEESHDQDIPASNLRTSTTSSSSNAAHHHSASKHASNSRLQQQKPQQNNGGEGEGEGGEDEDDDENLELAEMWVRRSWLRDFVQENFQCMCCRRMAIDPLMTNGGQDLVCRRCFDSNDAFTKDEEMRKKTVEAPAFIARAVMQLRNGLQSALLLSEAEEQEHLRNAPRLNDQLALQIAGEEQQTRGAIAIDWENTLEDLDKLHIRRLKARQPGTSRQLKTEGDGKYEAADYAAAYDCYSRAIDVNDNTQKLSGMYANRSAASFMLLHFADAIADCKKAVEIDPVSGPKMWARCQKCSLQLGDLDMAIKYCDMIAEANGGRMTDEQRAERARLAQGVESLRAMRTSHSAEEETYKLLMTRFPEAQHFRMMYCQEVMAAGKFEEVIMKLTHAPARTPKAASLLARALYMTGFEEFPRAKAIISEFAPVDAECRALQETIFKVDEHKQKGNDLFSHKHFADSISYYTLAIELAATNGRVLRVLYCNRAAAYKEVGRFKEGVDDCTKAISFDPKFCKAFARRARCLMGCQDYQSAVGDFKTATELEPTDMDLAREMRYAERLAADELAKEKDLYHVLGVPKTAVASEFKARWRELSLKYHPDKCVNMPDVQRAEMERKFKVISEAYQTLSNADSRAKYDAQDAASAYRRPSAFGAGGAAGGGMGAYNDLFRNAANPNRYARQPEFGGRGAAPPSFF